MENSLVFRHIRVCLKLTQRILLGLFLVSLAACGQRKQPPIPTPAFTPSGPAPTATHHQTSAPLPSATAITIRTPTPNVTLTKTVEPTWPPHPTRTPLVPTPVTGKGYRLTTWTPEKAEEWIAALKNYPERLGFYEQGYMHSHYYDAFKYAGLAELESALRFPQAEPAKKWQYDGAYHQYQSSSEDVARLYGGLIANALNQKETTLQDLESWHAKKIPFQLKIHIVTPPRGYQQSRVLHFFKDQAENAFTGGFAVWLLQKEETFFSYPLTNAWDLAYGEGYSTVGTVDLNGDGIAEAIIQNFDWDSYVMQAGEMAIYRLDQVPPQKIPFDAPPPDPSIAEWVVDQGRPVPTITFQVPMDTTSDMPCSSFSAGWQYQWKNNELKFIRVVPPSMEEMEQNPECNLSLIASLRSPEYLKNSIALEIYKQLLNLPSLAKFASDLEGYWQIEYERFYLARFLADIGDEAGAAEQIQFINASTEPSLAEWRDRALAYFAVRDEPQALLQFCLTFQKCFLDWPEKIALVPPSRFAELDTLLPQMGIQFQSSGNYDFDQDGQDETWLFFQDTTGCDNDLWILEKGKERINSRYISYLCLPIEVKVEITALPPSAGLLRYRISMAAEESAAIDFFYWPLDQEDPTISSEQANQMIFNIQNELLLNQVSPAEAQAKLMAVQNLPIDPELPDIQGHTLYLLGLAQELNGERTQAAQTYLTLWQTFPDDPYAMMAFAKLEPVP